MFGSDWLHEYPYVREHFAERAQWRLQFAWWPRRCIRSNRLIWLQRGYSGTMAISGPGDPAIFEHWMTRDQYLIYRLTQ